MKKLAFVTLLGFATTAAVAAPVGKTFTGFGVGLDLTTTKYKDAKRATGVGVLVDYGIDYGNKFVGLIEGKVKLNSSKLIDKNHYRSSATIDEKWRTSVSYLQGYRVLPDLLPYVKASYIVTKIKGNAYKDFGYGYSLVSFSETKSGLGFGVGVKYAISSNIELGAEYLRSRIKFDNGNAKGDTFGANVTYRF